MLGGPDYAKLAGSPCFKRQSAYLTPRRRAIYGSYYRVFSLGEIN